MSRVLPYNAKQWEIPAILDGRKTVIRRICKDVNELTVPDMSFYDADKRTYAVHNYADKEHTEKLSIAERRCPICPGDILYVRETWSHDVGGCYIHRASYKEDFTENTDIDAVGNKIKWHPSIHMPKEAARLWLKVTDVRVERLNDMTVEDAVKEGVSLDGIVTNQGIIEYRLWNRWEEIWNSTCKEEWQKDNPWVWVIEFERCEKPEQWKGEKDGKRII